jgi:hypothetical protein
VRYTIIFAAMVASLISGNALAQSRIAVEQINHGGSEVSHQWSVFTGINSASLAQQGAALIAATTLSFDILPGDPEQHRAVVTFWSMQGLEIQWADTSTIRCIDYFDQFMLPTGGACSVPRVKP